jgi:hypothetical protein
MSDKIDAAVGILAKFLRYYFLANVLWVVSSITGFLSIISDTLAFTINIIINGIAIFLFLKALQWSYLFTKIELDSASQLQEAMRNDE